MEQKGACYVCVRPPFHSSRNPCTAALASLCAQAVLSISVARVIRRTILRDSHQQEQLLLEKGVAAGLAAEGGLGGAPL